MTDLTALTAAITKLADDQKKLNDDFRAFLGTVTDPAQQAAVDALTAQITAVDEGLAALDALTKPA